MQQHLVDFCPRTQPLFSRHVWGQPNTCLGFLASYRRVHLCHLLCLKLDSKLGRQDVRALRCSSSPSSLLLPASAQFCLWTKNFSSFPYIPSLSSLRIQIPCSLLSWTHISLDIFIATPDRTSAYESLSSLISYLSVE